jgi:ABC-type multidrug transport system ATPase subunit
VSALEVRGLAKSFGPRRVLRGVDLTVAEGTRVLLRGKNGSGKSTLLQIASGVLTADAGTVSIFGVPLDAGRLALRALGYGPAAADFPPHMTTTEIAAFVSVLKGGGAGAHLAALDAWELGAVASATPETLSLGERRRLVLACATLGAPRLLLLDEPTVGLDALGRTLLAEALTAHLAAGGTQLLTSHEDTALPAAVTHTLADGRIEPA